MRTMLLRRHTLMTPFVICWTLLFHYESLRANYLSPLFHHELPKCPFLFPPAGWIMFFNIEHPYGFAEVYGIHGSDITRLDPHEIFQTRAIGYDNIRRNVLIGVLTQRDAPSFCRYLRRKFPRYEAFTVAYAQYPDLIDAPDRILRQIAYRCQ